MQFYRTRDFGELISATFDFVQKYGKNYFKNFFLINGIFLILIIVVFWFGFGEIFQQLFSSNTEGQQFFFEQYFTENQGVLIVAGILMFILFILLSLVNYSFPVLYMKRLSETGNAHITSNQMIDDIKKNIGKFFIFFVFIIIVMIPIMAIVGVISILLMMILIGFLIFLFAIPVIMNIVNFTLYHHYHTQDGIVNSFKFAFNAQFSKNFWKYWGSTIIIYLIINVISSIFSFIPMMFFFGSEFANPTGFNPDGNSPFQILVLLVYIISFVMSFILINFIYINTGFMYYDARKDLHREMQFSEIDTLGKREI